MPKTPPKLALAVESRILVLRRQRGDLAQLYGVPVGRLNEQVKRNQQRFPADFMFQLRERLDHVGDASGRR